MGLSNQGVLDRADALELALELLSFSGGENTVGEDQATKSNEARVLENWEALSLGGMQRWRGFVKKGDGTAAGYVAALDLLVHHKDSGGTETYGIINGDLVKLASPNITQEDAAAFTVGLLSHAVSAGDSLWITNTTTNLKKKNVGIAIATPASVPATACSRIYNHKNRLLAEGSTSQPRRVYGTRAGIGNWTAADAWSLANDAFSIDLPDNTQGCVPNFPTGNEVLVFNEKQAYSIYNFPNVAYRPIGAPSRGCSAPDSIAVGDEGIYFVSKYPTLGVFILDGSGGYTELTQFNRDVFPEKIDFTKRVFGVYRNRKYYLFYSNSDNGVSYPDTCRIYDARFGRWSKRPINTALLDSFGYPALLKYSANELYVGSSRKQYIYQMETDDDNDNGQDTQATFTTKDFSSRDFAVASGGAFPIDDVRMKLIKAVITYQGTVGTLGLHWSSDRGKYSGDKTINLTASGDLLGSTFIMSSSYLVTTPPDKTAYVTFPNTAVGRRFSFSLTNNGSSTRPKIKKVKIIAVALDEL